MKPNHLSQLTDSEGIIHCDDISKAKILNEYLTSIFVCLLSVREMVQHQRLLLDLYNIVLQ